MGLAAARASELTASMELRTKHVYDEASPGDGYRVLTDRLWPRGLSKERAQLDEWAKELAPSTELRKAFHHEDLPWPEFEERFRAELASNPAVAERAAAWAEHDVVTLLYGSHDAEHNQAVVLQEVLEAGAAGR